MAGRKKESFDRGRIEFKASPEWTRRMTAHAERLGLNLSSLIRLVMSQWAAKEEAEIAAQRKAGGK